MKTTWSGGLRQSVWIQNAALAPPAMRVYLYLLAEHHVWVAGWLTMASVYRPVSSLSPHCTPCSHREFLNLSDRILPPHTHTTTHTHSEASVGKRIRIVSNYKLGGNPDNRQIPASPTWWFYSNKKKKVLGFASFSRNARGLIVWENNLGK